MTGSWADPAAFAIGHDGEGVAPLLSREVFFGRVAEHLGIERDVFGEDTTLEAAGIDSFHMTELAMLVEELMGRDLGVDGNMAFAACRTLGEVYSFYVLRSIDAGR